MNEVLLWMQIIRRDERTGAPSLLFRVHVDRGIPWEMAQGLLKAALAPAPVPLGAAAASPAATASAKPQAPGLVAAAPSQHHEALTKPKQKLRIRFGGALVSASDGGKSDKTDADPEPVPPLSCTTDAKLPAAAPASAVTDACAAAASSPPPPETSPGQPASSPDALETHVSSVQELLQLHDMESQTRLDSLDAIAAATPPAMAPKHEALDDPRRRKHEGSNPQPAVTATPSLTHFAALGELAVATAVAATPSSDQPPAFDSRQQSPEAVSKPGVDFQGCLGSGSALGAVLGSASREEEGPGVSGYYRPERGAVRGLLLALEAQGKGQVVVYRPATGPAARPMRINELAQK